jgi:ABC-2 type transport system permease protein
MTEAEMTHARVGTLAHIGIATKYNFLNYFRARRFYVMLIIIALISGLFTALVAYYQPGTIVGTGDPLAFYRSGWGGFVNLVVVLSVVFFGGDAISSEFQNRTGYFLVPNPIRRSAIYVGKWLAALAASTIILGLFALTMLLNGLYYYPGNVPWEFVESFAFAWCSLVAALSLVFAFSSLFKSTSISIMVSVILLLFVFNIVDLIVSSFAGIEPWYSIVYGAGIVSNVLTNPFPAHVTTVHAGPRFDLTTYNATIPEGLLILAVYFVVMAVLGLWLFQRKEFTT